jgi:hypothetical protein
MESMIMQSTMMQSTPSNYPQSFCNNPLIKTRQNEKRLKPRQDIYMLVKYRTSRMTAFGEGILCNLSENGALFYTLGKLQANDDVEMMIASDNNYELPIQITAEVVREETKDNYGCRIKRIVDPNFDLEIKTDNRRHAEVFC